MTALVVRTEATIENVSPAIRRRRIEFNKRLKLAAPGLRRIPFAPQRTSCSSVHFVAPASTGAAAKARSVMRRSTDRGEG